MNLFTIIPFCGQEVVFESCHSITNLCLHDKFYCLKKSSYLTLLYILERTCFPNAQSRTRLYYCHIWSFKIFTMALAGEMVITWENKVEGQAFKAMLTVSGGKGLTLGREETASKVKAVSVHLEVQGQSEKTSTSRPSETLYECHKILRSTAERYSWGLCQRQRLCDSR